MITKKKNKRVTLIFTILLFVFSCDSDDCSHIDFIDFSGLTTKQPILYIENKIDNCSYLVKGDLWLNGQYYDAEGTLILKGNKLSFNFKNPSVTFFDYFDFSKEVMKNYSVKVEGNDNLKVVDTNVKARIDQIVDVDGKAYFFFRLFDSFVYENNFSDIVYIVTKENGIVGSYISELSDGKEYIIDPKGNILREYVDYSNKEFRKML